MKSTRTYVERRIAQLRNKRPCWSRDRRALDRGHIKSARRQHRTRIVTRPWARS
jgi:hypothetical protein